VDKKAIKRKERDRKRKREGKGARKKIGNESAKKGKKAYAHASNQNIVQFYNRI